jgi:hypothetical protein
MRSFHMEPILAGAYILLLMLIAMALEWMARHSQRRTEKYHTGGFRFHPDRDRWECPTGMALMRAEVDHELRIVRYRAPAHVCNHCPIKARCTHSDRGREIPVPMDPWLNSASLRFQTGFSLVLLMLSGFIAVIELFRHGHGAESLVMGLLLATIGALGKKTIGRLRTYTAATPTTRLSAPFIAGMK